MIPLAIRHFGFLKNYIRFSSTTNPAINAKSLVELRPFASLNVGSSDSFNF